MTPGLVMNQHVLKVCKLDVMHTNVKVWLVGYYTNFTSVSFPAEVDCGKLPDPENGIVALSGTTSGSIANYTCTDGYELTSGNNARVCENDGKWSGVDPACTANGIFHYTSCFIPCKTFYYI